MKEDTSAEEFLKKKGLIGFASHTIFPVMMEEYSLLKLQEQLLEIRDTVKQLFDKTHERSPQGFAYHNILEIIDSYLNK